VSQARRDGARIRYPRLPPKLPLIIMGVRGVHPRDPDHRLCHHFPMPVVKCNTIPLDDDSALSQLRFDELLNASRSPGSDKAISH
jgi:hypothetical protein